MGIEVTHWGPTGAAILQELPSGGLLYCVISHSHQLHSCPEPQPWTDDDMTNSMCYSARHFKCGWKASNADS